MITEEAMRWWTVGAGSVWGVGFGAIPGMLVGLAAGSAMDVVAIDE